MATLSQIQQHEYDNFTRERDNRNSTERPQGTIRVDLHRKRNRPSQNFSSKISIQKPILGKYYQAAPFMNKSEMIREYSDSPSQPESSPRHPDSYIRDREGDRPALDTVTQSLNTTGVDIQVAETGHEYEESVRERQSGFPNPQIYDRYYINSYSMPKGLHASRKAQKKVKDNGMIQQPLVRSGVEGWKLSKKPAPKRKPLLNQGRRQLSKAGKRVMRSGSRRAGGER